MASSAHTVPSYGLPIHYHKGERPLHVWAREGQTLIRWIVRVLVVITILTMITFWFWAILPAILLLVAFGLLMASNSLEKASRRRAATAPAPTVETNAMEAIDAPAETIPAEMVASEEPPDPVGVKLVHPEPEFSVPLIKRETKMIVATLLGIGAIALTIATVLFGLKSLAITGPLFFAYLLLLGGPVWLAALEDDVEEEMRQEHEAEHTRSA